MKRKREKKEKDQEKDTRTEPKEHGMATCQEEKMKRRDQSMKRQTELLDPRSSPKTNQIEVVQPPPGADKTTKQGGFITITLIINESTNPNLHRVVPLINANSTNSFIHSIHSKQYQGTPPECFQKNTQTRDSQKRPSKQSKRQIHTCTLGKEAPIRFQRGVTQLESGRIKSIELTQLLHQL